MIRVKPNTWQCIWHGSDYTQFLYDELRAQLVGEMMYELHEATKRTPRA